MKGRVIYTVLPSLRAGYFFWLHEKGKREGPDGFARGLL